MFDWIVQAVNNAMSSLAANLRREQILCLGVLDIFGFEIFEVCQLINPLRKMDLNNSALIT